MIVDGISAIIPDGISVMDFAIVAKTDQISARKHLEELVHNEIGHKENDKYYFTEGDRLRAAIFALEKGAEIDSVAEKISWRDFEGLVGEILDSDGFDTTRNFMLKNPRMEIDVVGIKSDVTILIDCKHWKRTSTSALKQIVKKQTDRTIHYVSKIDTKAIPVIVTMYQDAVNFVDNVPIVPITKFAAFLEEFYGNIEDMKTIERD